MYVITTALKKIQAIKKPVVGVQGGTGASKTVSILIREIDYAIKNELTETSVVAESVPHLKRGALKDFMKIMYSTGNWNNNAWNSSDKKYTFSNGSYIEFFSADDDSKLRGARRNRLFMNECNNMNFNVYTELASRTDGQITLDWNPTHKFWFHEDLQNDEDVGFLSLTYKDNECCPPRAKEFILKAKKKAEEGSTFWQNWYTVYGLGQIGILQGVVFQNWSEIDQVPQDARLICRGLDFGFTNDPTAIVDIYKYNDKIILDEICYRTGMLNRDIALFLKEQSRTTTWADSAEPKSIKEISNYGIDIRGVKNKNINYGISLMQEQDFLVTRRSKNLINEFKNYIWKTNKDGSSTNIPQDLFNHGMDAVRYGCVSTLSNKLKFIKARAS